MSLLTTAAELAAPQAALPLRLLSWCQGAGTYLLAHPMTGVALLAAVFGAVEHHEADKWARVAGQRGASIAAIQSASARATQQATAAKEAKDAQNAKLAADSDRTADALAARYHAAVLQLAAAQAGAGRADLSFDADPAQSGDRSGDSAQLPAGAEPGEPASPITIPRNDALTCADNTARLEAVHDWAVGLGE